MLPTIQVDPRWPREVEDHTYMLPWERPILLTLLERIAPKRMIEFGVQEGRTAKQVLKWIESVEYYLGVDVPFGTKLPLSGQQAEVPQRPAHKAIDDSRFELLLRVGTDDSAIVTRGPFDVAFIDGDHSYSGVARDYHLARQIVPPGGWLFFHDYLNATVQVTEFLEELHGAGMNIINIHGTMLAYTQL